MDDPFDLFLAWLSERGSGTWEDLKSAHAWLFGQAANTAWRRPSWSVYVLSAGGHIEMDWSTGRWSAAYPCLVNLPAGGAMAALVGARPAALVDRLRRETGEAADLDLVLSELGLPDGPRVFYVQYGSEADISELCSRLGAKFERYAALWMSRLLPSIHDHLQLARVAAAPPRGHDLALFVPQTFDWLPVESAEGDGMYRARSFGPDRHWFKSGDMVREVDRDFGMWAALARQGQKVMSYTSLEINGELVLPARARLPVIHARTAVLCSGLPPRRSPDGRFVRYLNVPAPIARSIAESLGQDPMVTSGGNVLG